MKINDLFESSQIDFEPIILSISNDLRTFLKRENIDIEVYKANHERLLLTGSITRSNNVRIEIWFYDNHVVISQFDLDILKGNNVGTKIIDILIKHLPKNIPIEGKDFTMFSEKSAKTGKSFWDKMKVKHPHHNWKLTKI